MGVDARSLGLGRRLGFVLAAAFLLTGCAGEGGGVDDEVATAPLPIQETKVRKWVEYSGGKVAWEFRGDVIRYYEEPERVEADGVVVDFYNEDEEYYSTLVADSGSVDRETSDMKAIGNVVITNRDGVRLETDWIQWFQEEEKIRTDAFVTIRREKRILTGYGLEADPGLEETEIKRDVVVFTVEESGE